MMMMTKAAPFFFATESMAAPLLSMLHHHHHHRSTSSPSISLSLSLSSSSSSSSWLCSELKKQGSNPSNPNFVLRSHSQSPPPPPPPLPRRSVVLICFSARTSSTWSAADESPYHVLGLEWDVDEDGIKSAYRKMAKQYHPDVYDGSVELEEGETPESRFIKIQAAYELLIDREQRRQYDYDNRTNPLKASKAWIEWIMKKKKAFEQRGDMAVSAWAEQQQRELNLKARRMAKLKMDPEEERKILAREKQASAAHFESTVRRHTLVLKKRDLMRRKQDESVQKQLVERLLAAEGLELADGDSDND